MTPGHISATLAVLGTGLSIVVFLSGCTNLENCVVRFKAPSEESLGRIQNAQRKLLADLDRVCASYDLKPLFEMAPCSTTNITAKHLNSPLTVGPGTAALVQWHSGQISAAVEKFVADVESSGDRTSAKAAKAYRNWDMRRARETERLLASTNLTWGQLNRARKQQMAELRVQIRTVFS